MRWTAALLVASLPSIALAQPVLAVRVGEGSVPPALVERAAAGLGDGALRGGPLAAELVRRFGRVVPAGDPLRAQRESVGPLVAGYYGGRAGRANARRGLAAAVDEMARRPDALELVEANRSAYLRALMLLAHDAREEGAPARAEPWLRRVVEFDRAWQPPPAEWAPALRAQLDALRGPPPTAEGTLTVRVAREGCAATVDGRGAVERVRAGSHRVAVTCAATARVRVVEVPAGASVVLTIDPRLDAALDLSATPGLRYATEAERAANAAGDAAAVGAALGASRVVTVDAGAVRVVDVGLGRASAEIAVDAPGFEARVAAAVRGEPAAPARAAVAPAARRGPGAGPWVLVGAGAAAAAAGAVLLGMSLGALGDVDAACPAHRCSMLTGAQRASAQSSYDDARTFNTAGWVALGVGAAAAVGGVVWYALASRRSEAPTVTAAVTADGAAVGVAGRF